MLDYECPQSLKDCMYAAGVNYQLTPPGTHTVDAILLNEALEQQKHTSSVA